MLKRIIVASVAVFSIGLAGCQSLSMRQLAGVSTTPGSSAAVQACEAQKRRMAGLVKVLGANYNAERVHNECVASAREAVASSKR